ncbi:MAG: autotransporter outer membrane beta-barrel domain-containing protein [Rhizobiales bacterium]|nr:autotransporter outer membrane beta-barrel domain-containing protein [Hyphomicrobiales bacterium]MBO6697455.1 autotransporter outer membrane beta-barrel domain-containing protein [Hyphomicrobiales bacterium]MBO6912760.1 autotransporter outer membrane beta-barrel domain-containing protein [Hyphomicrobiales bacterium]MBO6953929.1 autotransporter outer membrane beta-barrel domain-containing protein [Hyphomicrobiales bacterium]
MVAVYVALSFALPIPHLAVSPGHAACAPDATPAVVVTCTGTDTNGYGVPTPGINNLVVEEGALVTDTTGAPAGFPTAVINGFSGAVATFTNNGTVEATNPIRIGVLLDQVTAGDFVNTGTITGGAFADGVVIGILLNGGVVNSGTITGDDGLIVLDDTPSITNNGTIRGVFEDGIYVDGTIGTVTNTGLILGPDDAIDAITITSFNNSGTIFAGDDGVDSITITSMINSGLIDGVQNGIESDLIGSLTNTGTIFGEENAVEALNIDSITNFGLIDSEGDGIDVDGGTGVNDPTSVIGSIINHGTIRGDDDGIDVGTLTSLVNTGSIIGDFNENNDGSGIVAAVISSIVNSGVIRTDGDINATYAIEEREAPGGDTSLSLNAGSILIGRVDLGGGANTLNIGSGLSLNSTFESDGGASLVSIGSTSGHLVALVPVVINGNNEIQIVAVDQSAFLGFDDALYALVSGIGRTVQGRQTAVRSDTALGFASRYAAAQETSLAAFSDLDLEDAPHLNPNRFWIEGFGAYREDDSDRVGSSFESLTGGLVAGVDVPLDALTSVGVMAGFAGSKSENEINTQETDTTSYYAGVYASTEALGLAWDASLTVGYSGYDQERITANNLVAGGLETATADFGGWFINPQVTMTREAGNLLAGAGFGSLVATQTLEQSLTFSYAGLFLDGYTETGTTNPLTLDDRSIHVASARAALALPFEAAHAGGAVTTLRLIGGVEARTRFGDDDVSGTLLGQSVSTTLDDDNFDAGAFVGLAGEYQTTTGLTAYTNAEALLDTNAAWQVSATAGLRIAF